VETTRSYWRWPEEAMRTRNFVSGIDSLLPDRKRRNRTKAFGSGNLRRCSACPRAVLPGTCYDSGLGLQRMYARRELVPTCGNCRHEAASTTWPYAFEMELA